MDIMVICGGGREHAIIKKIREKIEYNTSKPQYIETIWGVGYRFKV